ncbi:DUF6049 family protein [Streptacidiphilus albus]|uniref:DUF6049 family protein n=1 Tax=Streptacidiphilus albus TaxID=105425 RepID=UPI00054BAD00|nr:DUF6049 family protein [Streptacidiphilus albus]
MGEAAQYRSRGNGRDGRRRAFRTVGRLRRAAVVLLASSVTLMGGTGLAPAAEAAGLSIAPATVTPAPAKAGSGTVEQASATNSTYPAVVSLTSITPSVPAPNGTVTITGTVRNSGSTPISSLQVGVAVGSSPLEGRSSITGVAQETTPQPNTDANELTSPAPVQLGTLAPGATTSGPFTLVIRISSLNLSSDGVYELDVDASGSIGGDSTPQPLGISRTYLPYFTSTSAKPTQVATLWPLVEQPSVQPQRFSNASQADQAVLSSDTLASDLGADGRLGQLESIGAENPSVKLSWVIDPDLVDTVNAMRGHYQVVSGPAGFTGPTSPSCGCTTAGSGSQAASTWLQGLQGALTGLGPDQVLALPYADPDLASLAHNRSDIAPLSSLLTAASSQSSLDLLQTSADHSVAWPYQGYLDSSVVSLTRKLHDTMIVANSDSLPSPDLTKSTPNAARSLGDGSTAVVADSAISDIFSGNLSTQSAQTMAEQRFLAETLEITEELPNQQRSILIEPPRDMAPSTADTLMHALVAAQSGRWIKTASFGTVAAATPTPGAGTSPAPYPSSLRTTELPTLPDVMGVQSDLDELTKILAPPNPYQGPFDAAILRSISTQWRDQVTAGSTYQYNTESYLSSLLTSVRILQPTGLALPGSNTATVPITVENNLPQAIDNLEVVLTSARPYSLKVEGTGSKPVSASGNTKPSFKFQVKAEVNGPVTLTARLWTVVDGVPEPYLDSEPISFVVNVTQVSDGVIAVIAGGFLLLVLAGLRLYWKRKQDAAAAELPDPDPESDPSGQEAGAAAEPPADTPDEDGAPAAREPDPKQPGRHDQENGLQSQS